MSSKENKIVPGGIYLINQNGNVDPEFGLNHYAVLLKTNKKELYLAFPLTTSKRRSDEKYTILRPETTDEEYILLYQTKPVSKNRVIGKKTKNGEQVIISEESCKYILNEYINYIKDLELNNIFSITNTIKNKKESKEKLKLECIQEVSFKQNYQINYEALVINYSGGKLSYTIISTKNIGNYVIEFRVVDKYGQKLIKKVNVNIY